jgi:hypothetical protein
MNAESYPASMSKRCIFVGKVARVEGLRGRISEAERQVEGLLSEAFA